jgi:hypothetical protein
MGRGHDGVIGMVWDESYYGVNSMDSVMFSQRTPSGWTPRVCLAPGRYPDVSCGHGTLAAGDSTRFWVAFSRWTGHPSCCSVHVWTLEDSLVAEPAVFAGWCPALAAGPQCAFLAFVNEQGLFGSTNDGSGWSQPEEIADSLSEGAIPGLCIDEMGWAWVSWDADSGRKVLACHNRGHGWSVPETVATGTALGLARVGSDEYGTMHCVWVEGDWLTGCELKHSVRLGRPGLEETMNEERGTMNLGPTVVRGVLFMPASPFTFHPSLFDRTGRKVMDLAPGPTDVRGLSPGVYFVREQGSGVGGQGGTDSREPPAVRKVVVQK